MSQDWSSVEVALRAIEAGVDDLEDEIGMVGPDEAQETMDQIDTIIGRLGEARYRAEGELGE